MACRHNRTIPDLSQPQNLARWRKIEFAKHRLFYTLLKLRLPLTTQAGRSERARFRFFGGARRPFTEPPVMTGHESGVITLNLAEADDVERERARRDMREPYRTLLGHFRHEISHYYWDRLVASTPSIEEFRQMFGDERQDYAASLQAYYANGPAPDWPERFVTAYASCASVGGFRRDLGALFSHGRYARDCRRVRAAVAPEGGEAAPSFRR